MKNNLLVLFFILSNVYTYAQNHHIQIRPRALDVGVYDSKKVVKNTYRVFHGEEAEAEFKKLLQKDENIKKKWIAELLDSDGNIYYIEESEILTYYPDLEIVISTGGHGYIIVDDINKEKSLCGDPITYAYSPSGKYRISGLYDDGMRYFLEKKTDGDYQCLDLVFYGGKVSGFYWYDDETIHYLKGHTRYTKELKEIKYWVGYSTKFYPIKK